MIRAGVGCPAGRFTRFRCILDRRCHRSGLPGCGGRPAHAQRVWGQEVLRAVADRVGHGPKERLDGRPADLVPVRLVARHPGHFLAPAAHHTEVARDRHPAPLQTFEDHRGQRVVEAVERGRARRQPQHPIDGLEGAALGQLDGDLPRAPPADARVAQALAVAVPPPDVDVEITASGVIMPMVRYLIFLFVCLTGSIVLCQSEDWLPVTPEDLQAKEPPSELVRPLQQKDWPEMFAAASDPLIWELHPKSDRYKEHVFREFFDEAMQTKGAFAFVEKKMEAPLKIRIGKNFLHHRDPLSLRGVIFQIGHNDQSLSPNDPISRFHGVIC